MLTRWWRRETFFISGRALQEFISDAEWVQIYMRHIRECRAIFLMQVFCLCFQIMLMDQNVGRPLTALNFVLATVHVLFAQRFLLKQIPDAKKRLENARLRCLRWRSHRN